MAGEYVFVDEWVVNAPVGAVFAAIADTRTYPAWWRPVYKSVDSNGIVGVGNISHHHLRGALPYSLKLTTEVTAFDPPRGFEFEATGDLRGRGIWTFGDRDGQTLIKWQWTVFADKPLLRLLTPLFRPVFRWNHDWSVARARDGLELYSREQVEIETRALG